MPAKVRQELERTSRLFFDKSTTLAAKQAVAPPALHLYTLAVRWAEARRAFLDGQLHQEKKLRSIEQAMRDVPIAAVAGIFGVVGAAVVGGLIAGAAAEGAFCLTSRVLVEVMLRTIALGLSGLGQKAIFDRTAFNVFYDRVLKDKIKAELDAMPAEVKGLLVPQAKLAQLRAQMIAKVSKKAKAKFPGSGQDLERRAAVASCMRSVWQRLLRILPKTCAGLKKQIAALQAELPKLQKKIERLRRKLPPPDVGSLPAPRFGRSTMAPMQ